MKILVKYIDHSGNSSTMTLDLDLSTLVSEVRNRISKNLDLPLSSFQLVTRKNTIKILMTDSWPLSFFIDEETAKLKVKQLDFSGFTRKESLTNYSPAFGALDYLRTSYSMRPLELGILACKEKSLQRLKALVEADENTEDPLVHSVQECQWGLLHYACLVGASEIVGYLVGLRVNCNKVTIDEWTPLQLCCEFQHTDSVIELLKHPAIHINKRTKFRGTALHIACHKGNAQIVQALLNKKPSTAIEDHRQKTAIEYVQSPLIFEMLAVFSGECQLRRYTEEECQVPFCSDAFVLNSFSLSDKQVFLYMDPEKGAINQYSKKEDFLDKKVPNLIIKLTDIQYITQEVKRKDQAIFSIETLKSNLKYYTKFEVLTFEWVDRIKKAVDYCMIHKQNSLIEQIVPVPESPVDEDSTNDSNLGTETETIDFSCFTVIEEIGNGSFGVVYKVQKNGSQSLFAMKSLSKSMLQKQKQLKYAISECKIMKQLSHPFIVPLHYAFQTPKYLYLILELCPNGDLLGLLEKKKRLEENIAKFYLAEVILALEYLHNSGIIYRDLKPANVLIDADFHAKLADFGLAKEKVNNVNPAMTMAGTPAYLPPEIVEKKGATYLSDIYGLGPLLFELLTGQTPYYSDDIDLLFQNIKSGKLKLPEYVSAHAKDFIVSVMNKDPNKRPQITQIKRHQLFRKLDWEALLAKRIRPPKID